MDPSGRKRIRVGLSLLRLSYPGLPSGDPNARLCKRPKLPVLHTGFREFESLGVYVQHLLAFVENPDSAQDCIIS